MATLSTCPDRDTLHRLLLGRINLFESESLARHLEQCSACAAAAESLSVEDTLIDAIRAGDTMGDAVESDTVRRLMERLRKDPPAPAVSGPEATAALPETPSLEGEGNPAVDLTGMLAPAQGSDELGRLGPYRILKILGAGGMGVVFQAEDVKLQRVVALKAMKPNVASSSAAGKRFLREARAMAALKHDHIVTIYQVDEDRGIPYLAMEFLEGTSLGDWLKKASRLSIQETLRFGSQIAKGLAAAHARGMVHRDIKPDNIWIEPTDGGRVKLLDFGLARAAAGEGEQQLTQQGAIVGTPAYMAPEQGQGKLVDHRSDLFSLGVALYRMVTGQLPFRGVDTVSTLMAVSMHEPPAPRDMNADVPASLSELILRLLEKDPAKRPASAQEVFTALSKIDPHPVDEAARVVASASTDDTNRLTVLTTKRAASSTRGRRWLVAAAVVLALGGLTWLLAPAILRLTTNNGTLIVEVDGDADVRFKNGKLQIFDEAGQLKYELEPSEKNKKLPPGKYQVKVSGSDGLKLDTEKFEMTRAGVTVRVTLDQAALTKLDQPSGNYALEFSERDAHVSLPIKLPPRTRFTWEAWITPKDQGDMSLCALPFEDGRGLYRVALKSGGPQAVAVLARKNAIGMTASKSLPASGPFHFAVVFDGVKWSLWVGGKKVGEGANHYAWVYEVKSVFAGKLGADVGFAIHPAQKHESFRGQLREIRISKNTRYHKEFTAVRRFETDADTVALYHCDEGKGYELKDSSGNGRHGLFVGAKWVKTDAPSSLDADRKAAEWVLSIAGALQIDNQHRDLRTLAELPKTGFRLTYVRLYGKAEVGDANLAALISCKNLKGLDLRKTKVSVAGIGQLRDALPGCRIEWDGIADKDNPFVLVRDGKALREFKSLGGAIFESKPGDVIEVHAKGPLSLAGLEVIDKPLTLRAAPGYRPWLVVPQTISVKQAKLDIEGIDFDARMAPRLFGGAGPSWEFRRCRFWGGIIQFKGEKVRVADSLILGNPAFLTVSSDCQVEFDNCLTNIRQHLIRPTGKHCTIRLKDSTFVLAGFGAPTVVYPIEDDRKLSVEATGNLFVAANGHNNSPLGSSVPKGIQWQGRENLYAGNWAFQNRSSDRFTNNLAEWNKLWEKPEEESAMASGLRLEWSRPNSLDWAGTRAFYESIVTSAKGRHKLAELGPDWDLIGPGDAYLKALAKASGKPIPANELRPEAPDGKPFVIVRAGKIAAAYLKLQDAITASQDQDVIELRTDGPSAGAGCNGKGRRLTIRAAPGYAPVVGPITSSGHDRLILERLTLTGPVSGTPSEGPKLFEKGGPGGIERVANCLIPGNCWGIFRGPEGKPAEVVNCWVGSLAAGMRESPLRLANCVVRHVQLDLPAKDAFRLEVDRCVLANPQPGYPESEILITYSTRTPLPKLSVNFKGNFVQAPVDFTRQNDGVLWDCSGNVYAVPQTYEYGRATWTLNLWREKYKTDADSFEDLPSQLDPNQWRIRPDSPGYVRRKDGRDFGADVGRILKGK